MRTKKCLTITNRNIASQVLRLIIVFGIASAVFGCSANLVPAGEDGIRIHGGDWIGKNDGGTFIMHFTIGSDGANIFLLTYSYPCGEKIATVFLSHPIKTPLSSGTFKTTIDPTYTSPKLVITGKFINKTHVEGEWKMFGLNDDFLEIGCPTASSFWKGEPD
jgi:hypothetical protein